MGETRNLQATGVIMSGASLELQCVAKRFQGVIAVDSVSLLARKDQVTGLIGPNGSGKTTTMNIISGLYPADEGTVLLDGVNISKLQPYRISSFGVARTFQNIRLLPDGSVLENVLLGSHRHQSASLLDMILRLPRLAQSESAARRNCEEVLSLVGIAHLWDIAVGELSYGDRRRVEIARALATQPRLLLLDEPAAGMNFAEKAALGTLIEQIRDMAITVVLIEHDIEFVSRVADHIVVLNFGREIAEGTPATVRQMPSVVEAYLGLEDA